MFTIWYMNAQSSSFYEKNQKLVIQKSPELFCDNCGHYPIESVHGHFVCPKCKTPTKCCEGIALDE